MFKKIILYTMVGAMFTSLAGAMIPPPKAQAAASPTNIGSWRVLNNCTVNGYKVNAIHASVTKTGKVLLTAGSGYNAAYFNMKIFKSWIWDPTKPTTCPTEVPMPSVDIFCSGHTHLADGSILFFGGTSKYGAKGSSLGTSNYYGGIREAYRFDDVSLKYVPVGKMAVGRWYPTGVNNAAGNPVVVSGLDENSQITSTNEVFSPTTNTWTTLPGQRKFPLYAGMTLRKNGTACYTGTYFGNNSGVSPQCWNWTNNTSVPISGLLYPTCRDQASGLMLPPAQNQKYMVIGGGCAKGTTGTTEIVDLNASAPVYKSGPYLGYAAMYTCADILPDWSIFVSGGGDHGANSQLKARRLAYGSSSWQTVASPTVPRQYHSTCLLLQDGTVITMGTNSTSGANVYTESRFEVYTPWYAQPGVVRPNISSISASTVQLGSSYTINYTGSTIKTASLTTLGTATHSSDPNMRLVQLGVTPTGTGKATLKIEPNWGILPLGVYMLSITDSNGVPSKAIMVRVVVAPTSKAKAATIQNMQTNEIKPSMGMDMDPSMPM